jgi:hypothetical protein
MEAALSRSSARSLHDRTNINTMCGADARLSSSAILLRGGANSSAGNGGGGGGAAGGAIEASEPVTFNNQVCVPLVFVCICLYLDVCLCVVCDGRGSILGASYNATWFSKRSKQLLKTKTQQIYRAPPSSSSSRTATSSGRWPSAFSIFFLL